MDLEQLSDDELIKEIKVRGLENEFSPNLWDYNDNEIEEEYFSRNLHKKENIFSLSEDLYKIYMTCSKELFNKHLKHFFSIVQNKNIL
jgi:hypothetical protein